MNPNGAEVSKCSFEYGTAVSYESSAPCSPSPGSESSPVAVSAPVTGLAANTTYHFRMTATNVGGTSEGSDQTFTTPKAPAYATSLTQYEGSEIKLRNPNAVAIDASGNIWVADSGNSRIVEYNAERKYIRQFGEAGRGRGSSRASGASPPTPPATSTSQIRATTAYRSSARRGNTCAR